MKKHVRFLALLLALLCAFSALFVSCEKEEDEETEAEEIERTEKINEETHSPDLPEETTSTPETDEVTTEPETTVEETTEHVHEYATTENAATCTAEGSIISTCSCGDKKTEALPKIDHNFVDNKCSMCGLVNVVASTGLKIEKSMFENTYVVTGIGNCTDTDIVIPETYEGLPVNAIHVSAFDNCKNIVSVYIPKSIVKIVYTIGSENNLENPFESCSALEKITVSEENTVFKSIDNCLINIEEKTLISGCKNSKIPADGSVRIIATAFKGCSELLSITIPNTIEEIGYNAFYECSKLTSVKIPESVKSIGWQAFYSCTSLKEINIPSSLTSIENSTFAYCSSLEKIVIPDSVTDIKMSAFYSCSSLKEFILGKNVINIANEALLKCDAINYTKYDKGYYVGTPDNPYYALVKADTFVKGTIDIHKDTKVIGGDAFFCTTFSTISIPEGVIALSDRACTSMWSVDEIILPDSLIHVGSDSIPNFDGIKYNIYENGKYMGTDNNPYMIFVSSLSNDIDYCIIHKDTKFITEEAFKDHKKLKTIVIGENISVISDFMFSGCIYLETVTINGNINEIGDYAFSGCISLKSITIPDSVKSIGSYAFEKCLLLTSAIIPDHITSIPDGIFAECTALKDIKINENITSIGDEAFKKCQSLESFTFKNTLKKIGDRAFYYCKGIKKLEFYGTNEEWEAVKKGQYWMLGCDYSLKVTIIEPITLDAGASEGIVYTKDKDGASYYVSSVGTCTDTNIVISAVCNGLPVLAINNNAFDGCSNIMSVVLPESIKYIYSAAFKNCKSLKTINIPESVEGIAFLAFQNCTSLEKINIPAKAVVGNAFVGCTSLSEIKINPANAWFRMHGNCLLYTDFESKVEDALVMVLGEVELPNDGSIKMILQNAFYESNIKEIVIPEGVTLIDANSFSNCRNLEKITLPESLTSLGGGIFEGCSSLKEVYIPKNVNVIKSNPFSNCPSIESIKVDPANTTYRSVDNCIIDIANKTLVGGCSTSIIPNDGSVTVIGTNAFSGMENIKSIELSNHITKLDMFAFYNCTGLEKFVIPDSVTEIETGALSGCTSITELVIGNGITKLDYIYPSMIRSLKKLTIGSGITVIEKYDLSSCTASEIIISKSIKKIEASAMTYNDNVTTIRYDGTVAEWNAIEKEEGWDTGSNNYTVYCSDGEIKK